MVFPEGRNVGCRGIGGDAKSSGPGSTTNSAMWLMNDSFLGVYFLRGYGIRGGGQLKARAIVEFRSFVDVSYEAFCWASSKPKKKKNWPGGDDKCKNMTPLAFNFSSVAESVLAGSNGWQYLWRFKNRPLSVTELEGTESKQSDYHVEDNINNVARKLQFCLVFFC